MKRNFLSIIIILSLISSCATKVEIGEELFLQIGSNVSFFEENELMLSKINQSSKNGRLIKIVPNALKLNLKNSLVAQRNHVINLPLKSRYYYHVEDSVVDVIIYEWNKAFEAKDFTELEKIQKKDTKYHKIYVKKFNLIASYLTSIYGEAIEGDGQIREEEFINGFSRWYSIYKWKVEEEFYELELSLIPNSSYRVRLKVY